MKRLLNPAEPVKLFFQRAQRLKEKLDIVLWQFSPAFAVHFDRLTAFLKLLKKYPARNAFEFRHESWLTEGVISLCREQNVCLCMADWPAFLDDLPMTADFVYLRRHGEGGSYATKYSSDELKKDAVRIRKYLRQGKDVSLYFNNDFCGHAPERTRGNDRQKPGRPLKFSG